MKRYLTHSFKSNTKWDVDSAVHGSAGKLGNPAGTEWPSNYSLPVGIPLSCVTLFVVVAGNLQICSTPAGDRMGSPF